MRLKDKVAIVTGAASGMGASTAKIFAAEGAKVLCADMLDAEGKAVVGIIEQAGGTARFQHLDVSDEAQWRAAVEATLAAWGTIDVLVNNAGVYEFAPIDQVTEASYRRMFDLNVLGTVLSTQAALKSMNGSGSIINVSSVAALTPIPTGSLYSATKGAVDVITRRLAEELGPRKIRVNSLAPGLVETEGTRAAGTSEGNFKETIVARTPLGRVGTVDDIAKVAVFLASDDSGWITGEVLPVGGGARL